MANKDYQILPHTLLSRDTTLHRPECNLPLKVTLEDSALSVMTDLSKTVPVVISPESSLDFANDKMITYGVRMLFVLAAHERLVGIITSVDLMGEKPLRIAKETGLPHHDLIVSDIMTPRETLEAIYLDDVINHTVGDIVATMKSVGRQHALVLEKGEQGEADRIRGIISTTQLTKQLGIDIISDHRATTFAELEVALTSVA